MVQSDHSVVMGLIRKSFQVLVLVPVNCFEFIQSYLAKSLAVACSLYIVKKWAVTIAMAQQSVNVSLLGHVRKYTAK